MIILPAIDILDQQPVRLYQGDYEQKECVGDSIGDIAKAFEQRGEGRKENQSGHHRENCTESADSG